MNFIARHRSRSILRQTRSNISLRRRHFLSWLPVTAHAPTLWRLAGKKQFVETTEQQWGYFKARFLLPEGRIIDTGNGDISHSEGQGIGLLAAARSGDHEAFIRILTWTNNHLIRATDRLYAWRYKPNAPVHVDDPNNATDGDILIAWGLLEAAKRWNDTNYYQSAYLLVNNIRADLIRSISGRSILLPGSYGFDRDDQMVINPSYYIFPAFQRFIIEWPNRSWVNLYHDGISMLRETLYGRWKLPPDWAEISIDGSTRIAQGWPPRFSWDAVRIPLYMAWAGLQKEPAVTDAISFWNDYPLDQAPAWVDLQDGATAPYAQNSGLKSIRSFVEGTINIKESCKLPSVMDGADYYAAALTLLSYIARDTWRDNFHGAI